MNIGFYGEELAPRPTPKLEDHPLSAVCKFLFSIFAATFHIKRPFLHPQPEDTPFHSDRDPLIMIIPSHYIAKSEIICGIANIYIYKI